MMAHLSDTAMGKVLGLCNKVWQELPGSWKQAVVVPIRKLGKDPNSPSSYSLIALTSHVCTFMERMITERLTYFLERRGLIKMEDPLHYQRCKEIVILPG
jgi:hypothetical protein